MNYSEAAMKVECENRTYLDLFVQHTRKQLEAEILAACRSSIDKAVDQAIADLRPQIEQFYDQSRDRASVVLMTRKVT
jgi:hypothetical protein